ncbi:MAG TPA: DUF2911 domain-containing protein [Acidobacteria bacterium]|nr:DUF2911 domain-containing protein [Acidobacteriota bacterium]
MFGLKTGAAVVCAGLMTVGCGGGGDEMAADAPASSEAAPPVESAPPAQRLGGGALTPVHEGTAGSPHVQVAWEVSGANISLTYGRPLLKGRVVGDDVEPLDGRVWRLGADEATILSTDRDLMMGSAHVPAGEYTLWTITNGDTTELIVSSETGQWGTDYNESNDLARAEMTVSTLDAPVDQLTLHLDESELRLEWGSMAAAVPIMVH